MKAVLVLALLALTAVAAFQIQVQVPDSDAAASAMAESLVETAAFADVEAEADAEDDAEEEADDEADEEMDAVNDINALEAFLEAEEASEPAGRVTAGVTALKAARVVANPLMRAKHVISVPKGDPRAHPPTNSGLPGAPSSAHSSVNVGAAAAAVAPVMPPALPVVPVASVAPLAVVPAVPVALVTPIPAEAADAPAPLENPPITLDTSVPDGQWTSEATDLVPVLQAAAGAYCTPSATNIRSQPTTSGAVLLTTTAGEQVRVTATTERAANGYTWVPVTARSKSGWVAKSLIGACRPAGSTTTPSGQTTVSRSFPLYKQCGQSWSGARLGTCAKTVCSVGCAVSSVAMILRSRGLAQDPGTLNTWLTRNGGFANGCSIYWAKVDALGKTRCQGFQNGSFATLCGWVKAGKGVVVNVNSGRHWVLVTGCDSRNNVLVNDPGYARSSYPFSAISRQVVYN